MFHEMLQRDFGNLILQAILSYCDPTAKKRKRDSDQMSSPTFSSPSLPPADAENNPQSDTKKVKTEPNPEQAVAKEEPIPNQEEIKLEETSVNAQQPEESIQKEMQEQLSPTILPKKEKVSSKRHFWSDKYQEKRDCG